MAENTLAEWTLPIDEEFLRASGFKWHEFERSGGKHWVLWLGSYIGERERELTGRNVSWTGTDDLGVEVASWSDGTWFCWLRSDTAHRYHRFIHLRHIRTRLDLISIVEGIAGCEWKPANHFYGCVHTDEAAARIRTEHERLDRKMLEQNSKWREVEKDETRGRPLQEHLEASEKCRTEHPSQGAVQVELNRVERDSKGGRYSDRLGK